MGRPYPGPSGVVRSYEEAAEALDVAERLGLPEPVASAADLLVYQVLLRDRTAITDLVRTVLMPLGTARGGAAPLLATLAAYFARGGVAAAAARDLHLSVRAVDLPPGPGQGPDRARPWAARRRAHFAGGGDRRPAAGLAATPLPAG